MTQMNKQETEVLNKYTGISQYYDTFMTAGYYDYQSFAETLVEQFGQRRQILELGIGTGLVCEKLLGLQPELQITGLDYTDEMVQIAKQRLGDKVNIIQQDVVKMESEPVYDAAFSVGGVWYFIHGPLDQITFCSHIFNKADNFKALKNIHQALKPGGLFIFAVQGTHTNYEKQINDELVYAQEIHELEDHCFIKDYFIKKHGEVVAEQRCHYRLFPHTQAQEVLSECGFEFVEMTENRLFHVYRKK